MKRGNAGIAPAYKLAPVVADWERERIISPVIPWKMKLVFYRSSAYSTSN
jgi:hypothetical protein